MSRAAVKIQSIIWVLLSAGATLILALAAVSQTSALPGVTSPAPAPAPTASLPAGVRVLRSDHAGLLLEIHAPAYQVLDQNVDGNFYQQIVVAGAAALAEVGKPELPKFSALIGVPAEAQIAVRILDDHASPVAGSFRVWPAPSLFVSDDQPTGARQRIPDQVAYLDRAWYPATAARVAETAWLRDQRLARLEFYPFQYQANTGALLWHSRLLVEISFTGAVAADPVVTETAATSFETLLSNSLLNYETARNWRSPQTARRLAAPDSRAAPALSTPAYKITVDHDGLYRVTYADLASAGLVMTGFDPRQLHLTNQGLDVAVELVGEEDGQFDPTDYLLFYGQRLRGDLQAARHPDADDRWLQFGGWRPRFNAATVEKYTDENVYWLAVGLTPGLRMSRVDGTPQGAPQPDFYTATVRAEKSMLQRVTHYSSEDTWFWDELRVAAPATRTYTTTLTAIYPGASSAAVRAEVAPYSYQLFAVCRTIFRLNRVNPELEDTIWTGRHRLTATVPSSVLLEGTNYFTWTLVPSPSCSWVFFDWFDITYWRRFQANDNQLAFEDERSGPRQYAVTGLTTDTLRVLDVSDPWQPRRVFSDSVMGEMGMFTLTYQVDHNVPVSYFVSAADRWQAPRRITRYDPPIDWRDPSHGADYVIITHRDFYTAMQRLANYREAQGLRVKLVDVADLYDQFTDGIYHSIAIKDFLAYAYANWQPPAPSYVVLVGDGHWNFKGNNSAIYSATVYLPPHLAWIDPYQGEVDSANELVTLVGSDPVPEMLIGRIPVNTAAEAAIVVSKTIAYESQPPELSWKQHLVFVADNTPDPAGDFVDYSNDMIRDFVAAPYTVTRIYANDFGCGGSASSPECAAMRLALTSTLNQTGALFLNYIGHGANGSWGENFLALAGVPTFDNLDRLPIVLSMTCLDAYWIHATQASSSLMETMLRAANGGMVASFSPTGFGVSTGHDVLERGLLEAVFQQHVARLGPATLAGKLKLYGAGHDHDLLGTFVVIGDPALRLPIPRLVSLTATSPATDPAVTVDWTIGADISARGYTVWRGPGANGPWLRVSGFISPSAVIAGSASYQWLDHTTAPGTLYYYRIEELQADQTSIFYGPVSVVSGVPQYALTVSLSGTGGGIVSSTPSGIQCGLTCAAVYSLGTVVTLTAVPDTYSFWGGWNSAGSGTPDWITLTMTANQAVSANFVRYAPDLSPSFKLVNLSSINGGDILTYTIHVQNVGTIAAAARVTDIIPALTHYITGSASASAGVVTVTNNMLYWSGNVEMGTPVVIQLAAAALPAATGTVITNTAELDDGQGHIRMLQAVSVYNPGFRLIINDGALYTNNPTVSLSIRWAAVQPPISEMAFSNDKDFSAGFNWVPAAETWAAWPLSLDGDWHQPRTVYATFRDSIGQTYSVISDDILYDPVPPQISEAIFIPVVPPATTEVVHVRASDDNSGIHLLQLSSQADMSQPVERVMTGSWLDVAWPLPGLVFARVIDRAGNLSTVMPVQHNLYLPVTRR
jgi:uncharacterized repeat protein (TIGR01451 family)